MNEFNVLESIQGQKKYCEEQNLPHFAPGNGICWNCNRNIYEPGNKGFGITSEQARNELVTGCPHCNRSYCD
ncbi:hypothetical protein [Oceanobacillus sp. CF4.6]|uniref:hypothetical protein n=1 Tax=Oceanobacillus sp. CF4.6 TaxID=3373080 RepID=UPI003EE6F9E4